MATYQQFFDSIETVICYASRYNATDVQLIDVKIGPFLAAITVTAGGGGPVEDLPEPIDFNQFGTALELIAEYCQEQKIPSSQDNNIILGKGVTASILTEWAVMGAFDQTTLNLTATRTTTLGTMGVTIENGRFMKSNVA